MATLVGLTLVGLLVLIFKDISHVFGPLWRLKNRFKFWEIQRKNPSRISTSKLKTQINKMLAHCFNPQLARGRRAVVWLASAAVNQSQPYFKYRFLYSFPNIWISLVFVRFNKDIIIHKSRSLLNPIFGGLLSHKHGRYIFDEFKSCYRYISWCGPSYFPSIQITSPKSRLEGNK